MRGHIIGLSIGCGRGNGERIRSPADGGVPLWLFKFFSSAGNHQNVAINIRRFSL